MGMAEVGAPISLDGWQSIQIVGASACYLHFAPENPEDSEMYLLVLAHPGCPRQSPESRKMVVHACVRACVRVCDNFVKMCNMLLFLLANSLLKCFCWTETKPVME